MTNIRALAVSRGARIKEPRIQDVQSVPVRDDAQEKHADLVQRFRIGSQYLWLSSYARYAGLDNLELCIHIDDRAYAVVNSLNQLAADGYGLLDEAEEALFLPFSFPILGVSKKQMLLTARENGFDDLMELTWFCQEPTKAGKACGLCNPCRWTVQEGLGYRLSLMAKVRSFLSQRLIWRLPGRSFRKRALQLLRVIG